MRREGGDQVTERGERGVAVYVWAYLLRFTTCKLIMSLSMHEINLCTNLLPSRDDRVVKSFLI